MPNLGPWEIALIVGVLVLLFGATRLPKAAEGIGKALKVFKKNVRESADEDEAAKATKADDDTPAAINPQAGGNGAAATASDVPQTHDKK